MEWCKALGFKFSTWSIWNLFAFQPYPVGYLTSKIVLAVQKLHNFWSSELCWSNEATDLRDSHHSSTSPGYHRSPFRCGCLQDTFQRSWPLSLKSFWLDDCRSAIKWQLYSQFWNWFSIKPQTIFKRHFDPKHILGLSYRESILAHEAQTTVHNKGSSCRSTNAIRRDLNICSRTYLVFVRTAPRR